MFLGRQGNPFCTRQEQKHETHRNPSALILMNLNDPWNPGEAMRTNAQPTPLAACIDVKAESTENEYEK